MVANTSSSSKRVVLLLAAAVALMIVSPASARRRPVRLRLYMQDIVGGPGQTAVLLVRGSGPENPSMHPGNYFGDTVAVDDLLTAGLAVDSAPVGRAQGTYMTGSMSRPVFVVSVTLHLAAGPYNGSTLVVAGRDDTSEPVRELAVVGGTGALRRAEGHVLWSTAKVVSPLHAVLELDVHASVPVPTTLTALPTTRRTRSIVVLQSPPPPAIIGTKGQSLSLTHHGMMMNHQLICAAAAFAAIALHAMAAVSLAAGTSSGGKGTNHHLHLFMHVRQAFPSPTAVIIVNGTGAPVTADARFGDTVVMDNVLTEGPSRASRQERHPAMIVSMTVVLTDGSTVAVMGHNDITLPVRELAVVGGTGRFRMASGYVLWKTTSFQRKIAVLQLDVHLRT
ncbi:hypothetical protein HU200_034805 [Digitaria exilis]|uniref:Dirigent protein n=1 Tax=Digitaria exilis TaxID=1010633 RepID=A0A835BT82_9POAL|nr:hypothetical protein HU200_034805 [Digitaria exilis]